MTVTPLPELDHALSDDDQSVAADAPARPMVVVGTGPVGIEFAQRVLNRAPLQPMVLYGDEPWEPYDRVRLTALLAGETDLERLSNSLRTTPAARVVSHWNCAVTSIDRVNRRVLDAEGRWQHYDKLILAVGSSAAIPDVAGIQQPGVYKLRDMGDVQQLMARRARSRHTLVLGGGLLGLEAARALQRANTRVTLVHRGPRLLNRQFDDGASDLLRQHLESLGIDVLLNSGLRAVHGDHGVTGVTLGDGRTLACDTVVVAIGIRPNTQLALEAGLSVGDGIRVNDAMQTSDPDIYAIGECAEHRGEVHGIVAPGIEQAGVAAHNVLGGETLYTGSIEATSLKVVGQSTFSIGRVGDAEEAGFDRAAVHRDDAAGTYRKVVTRRGRAVGAVAIGDWDELGRVREAVTARRRLWPWQTWRLRRSGRLWPAAATRSVRQWPARAVVCNCRGVDCGTLTSAIDGGADSVQALMETTGASTVCGSCRPLLEELVSDASPDLAAVPKPGISYGLMGLSLLALLVAFIVTIGGPLPYSTSVQAGPGLDVLWTDGFWKQTTGYTVLGLSVFGLVLSLRKRTRFSLGSFTGWRLVHVVLGVAILGVLLLHTGMHLGHNLNLLLMLNFLAILALGSLAGTVASVEQQLPPPWGGRLRRFWTWAHILLLWPFPALLGFHVLAAYYY